MENIYGLPSVSSENEVHLQRYIKFISSRPKRDLKRNGKLYNIHHIVPRGLNGLDTQENLIKLTHREHWLAHLMLYKAYGGPMTYAFCYLSKKGKITNSRVYKNAIELLKSSELQINNGIINMTVYSANDVPPGFILGRFTSEECKKSRSIKMKEKIWITDGVTNKRIEKNTQIPENFNLGKTERTRVKRDHAAGKVWITDGVINKYIDKDSLVPEGYHLGFVTKQKKIRIDKNKLHIWINNGSSNKFITEDSFYLYENEYEKGRIFSEKHIKALSTRVICLNTNKKYNSIHEAVLDIYGDYKLRQAVARSLNQEKLVHGYAWKLDNGEN